MKLEWMGKYRAFVEAMIRFGNSYIQIVNVQGIICDDANISPSELQVMEYILENEERHENMSQVAGRLQISQSSFSKIVKQLVSKGLLEKYHTASNRKNIIVRPSELAREVYDKYSRSSHTACWRRMFALFDSLDEGAVSAFTEALNIFSNDAMTSLERLNKREDEDQELIRIE